MVITDVELIVSTLPDDHILLGAFDEVISLHDIGYQQGYEDGLGGKPIRKHPTTVPELFQVVYAKGHEAGRGERNDRGVCREIARHERRLGLCREEHVVRVVPHNEVKVERQDSTQESGFWSTYTPIIATFVGTGILFGLGGWWTGRAQEQKRCMSVRREMGVDE